MRTAGVLLRSFRRIGPLVALVVVAAGAVDGAGLLSRVDLAQCDGSPAERVSVEATDTHLRFVVQPEDNNSSIRVVFREALSLKGKERLVLEGRSEESSGQGTCLSRISLHPAGAGEDALYEPDLRFPPEWNQRTVLLNEFEGAVPEEVRAVTIHVWAPDETGGEYRICLRRCEFLSRAEVARELTVSKGPARARKPARALPVAEDHRRWVNFGPGGGGWYRVVAISPHDGACFVGGDVGGVYRSLDGCRTWRICNAGIPNTYINTFAFHPTDERIVFAGSNGGVLKSTDGGTTWSIKREGFPPLLTFDQSAPISAIAIDPARPETVYAGVGHERGYGALRGRTIGGRIFKSADGGETWRMIELPGDEEARKLSVFCIRFHPGDTRRLYASTQKGLFTSSDAGESWERLGKGLEGYLTTFLVIKQDEPSTMLLAYRAGRASGPTRGGVLKSTDGGATWAPSNEGLPAQEEAWRIIAHPTDSDTYYVGWHRRSGMFVTHDCGATWQPVNMSGNIRSAWFFEGKNVTGIDIDPRNPDRLIYCNDMDLYQTVDGGADWDQVATDLVRPATEDHPAVWRGRGAEILCAGGPQALAVDPTNPRTLYFGYWDTHAWKSDDGGETCYRLTNGISSGYGRMGAVVLDPANPDIVYLSKGHNYDRQRIYKSINGGREFHLVGHEGTGLPPGGVFCMVIDPSSPIESRTIYAAVTKFGAYKSEDGGLTWPEQSRGLPADSRMVKQIAMDPRNPRRLFLASGAHYHSDTRKRIGGYIARSTDGGEHWQVVKDSIEPQCIVIDPFDSQKVYAGNRNFSGVDYPNAFYKSVDGGDTWTSLDQEMFLAGPGSRDGDQGARVYVRCLAADPTTPGTLYAACQEEGYDVSNGRGVFISKDWGETWEPFVLEGLTNYRVGTLVVDPVNPSRLYAGTGGNGFFRFGPPPETTTGVH